MKALKVVRNRCAKEGLYMMKDAKSANGFGGQLGDVAFTGKIMADTETQKVQEGRLFVNSCDWVQTWQSLSPTQRRSLKFRYRKGCTCQIRRCWAWPCGAPRESECWWTDWLWQGKVRGHQARHYACLRRAGKSCSWYRNHLDHGLGKTNDQTQQFP
uniref:Uncharacterized protein n=1 Tax=Eptatretus burgeri TaxID=7764 RepID=A0A8C4R5S8_EPTBU